MTQKEAVARWTKSAKDNLVVARDLMKLGHYDWALFMGQLTLEKFLKGIYTEKKDDVPPYIHDLAKLIDAVDILITESERSDFVEITRFHIQARYEDVKRALYKKATKSYATKWMEKIERYVLWLKKHY